MALVPKFKAKGIIPMTTDGKDAWPLSITFDNLSWRISGDFTCRRRPSTGRSSSPTRPS